MEDDLSDEDLSQSASGMKALEAALARFNEASAAARQRLSDAAWADLLEQKEARPEVTLDDIIEAHNKFVASLDAMASPLQGLEQQVKASHRTMLDALLDAKLGRNKK